MGTGRVHNLSLAAQQQNYLLLGGILLLVGVGLLISKPQTPQTLRNCPFCAEMIQPDALVCRFCQRDLPPPTPVRRAILPLRDQIVQARWILLFTLLLGLVLAGDYIFQFHLFPW
jgi:hypothetical protein